MVYTHSSSNERLLTFILSVLLHIIALLLLFAVYLHETRKDVSPDFAQVLPQPNPAQVIFHDEPEEQQRSVEQPATVETPQPQTASATVQENSSADTAPQEYTWPRDVDPLPNPVTEDITASNAITAHTARHRPQRPRTGPSKKRQRAAQGLKKLTQSFRQSSATERVQKTKVEDDIDLLARQIYQSKVMQTMRQSAKRIPLHHLKNFQADAVMVITLDRNGNMLDFKLDYPKQDHDLSHIESALYDAFSKAGLYPFIPASIKSNPITLSYKVRIDSKAGFNVYELH